MKRPLLIAGLTLYGIHDLAGFAGTLVGGAVVLIGLCIIRQYLTARQDTLNGLSLLSLKVLNHAVGFLSCKASER